MILNKLVRYYLIASIVASFAVFFLIKYIIEMSEFPKTSMDFIGFCVFHLSYAFVALNIHYLVSNLKNKYFDLFVLILLLPLSLFESLLVLEATNEALAFGLLPVGILRLVSWFIISSVYLALNFFKRS